MRKFVNYDRKKFCNIGPSGESFFPPKVKFEEKNDEQNFIFLILSSYFSFAVGRIEKKLSLELSYSGNMTKLKKGRTDFLVLLKSDKIGLIIKLFSVYFMHIYLYRSVVI